MFVGNYTVDIYVFKVNNEKARAMYEMFKVNSTDT